MIQDMTFQISYFTMLCYEYVYITSKQFSDNCLCLSPTQPMKTSLTAIPGYPGKKMGHTSSPALDSTCSISTDTPARASGTDFNQVEDFKTAQGCSRPISAGSNLEDAMPPFPIVVI
ncbi:hypothetical protein H671_6g15273 [Cricetulus griseus]|nr:hypothetical protein H671_6g15273 [Cricetulus griseus]